MRRLNSCIRRIPLSLLMDCAYYCWQHMEITDEEYYQLEQYYLNILNERKENDSKRF